MLSKHVHYQIFLSLLLVLTMFGCGDDSEADTVSPEPGNLGKLTYSEVTEDSVLLSWVHSSDNESAREELVYRVVTSSSANVSTLAEVESNGVEALSWTSDLTSFRLTNLVGPAVHAVVVVRDGNGNEALYDPVAITLKDTVAPVPGGAGALTLTRVDSSTVFLSWAAASDDVDAAEVLEYVVVRADADVISTLPGVMENGRLVTEWSTNVTDASLSGLSASDLLYLNVWVRDLSGQSAVYQSRSTDLAPPTPVDADHRITVTNVAENTADLSWALAIDNVTPAPAIEYAVVHSLTNNISSAEDAIANGTLLVTWTTNIDTTSLSGLTAETQHYFNILARDAAGNTLAFLTTSLTTTEDTTPPVPGTLTATHNALAGLTWTAATDLGTSQDQLEYKIISSTNPADLVDLVIAEGAGTVVADWTVATTSIVLDSLADGRYSFAVFVRDARANWARYDLTRVIVGDDQAPTSSYSVRDDGDPDFSVFMLATDNVTPRANIELLFLASTDANLTVATIASGTVLLNWATYPSLGWTSFTENSTGTVFFYVAARDEAGNVALSAATPLDRELPTVTDANLVVTLNTTGKSVSIDWTASADDYTDPTALQYMIRYSSNDELGTAADIGNGSQGMGWTTGAQTGVIPNLQPTTMYYANVFVKDEGGNVSAYTSTSFTTLADTEAPIVGNLTVTPGLNSFTAWWTAADDGGLENALEYLAVYSETTGGVDIDTLSEALAKASSAPPWLFSDWATQTFSAPVDSLANTTPYWVSVVVRDPSGNMALYGPVSTTTTNELYLFAVESGNGYTSGWLTPTGSNTTRREQANWLCEQEKPVTNAHNRCDKTIGFISLSNPANPASPDQISSFDVLYGIPFGGVPLMGGGTDPDYIPTQIAADMDAFLTGPLDASLQSAGVTFHIPLINEPNNWLSFSDANGDLGADCETQAGGHYGQKASTTKPFYLSGGWSNSSGCTSGWLVCLCY